MNSENIDGLAKALTHLIFRNGPVEALHADGKQSDNNMKTLNPYMVNRLAGILCAPHENRWLQLELLHSNLQQYGNDWGTAEPDMEEPDVILKYRFEDLTQGFREKRNRAQADVTLTGDRVGLFMALIDNPQK